MIRLDLKGIATRLSLGAVFASTLGACSSAAPPPAKVAAPPLPTVIVANKTPPVSPLTPVIAPETSPEMALFAKRLAATIDGARPQVTPVAVDLDALPRVTMKAPLDAKVAAKLDISKLTEDPNLMVKPSDGYARQYMINVTFKDPSKITFARVRITGTYGLNEGWFGEGQANSMNVYQGCGRAGPPIPVQSESVLFEKGSIVFTTTDGVLDRLTCRVLRVSSGTATAKPMLANGILYGFRSCEGSCDEKEELTVLFPRASSAAAGALGGGADRAVGAFSMVTFPIQRGGGGAFVARISKRDASEWLRLASGQTKATDSAVANPAPPPTITDASRLAAIYLTSFEVGVEVSQARDENSPLAIAYTDADLAGLLPTLVPSAPAAVATTSTAPPPNPSGLRLLDDRR